MNLSKLFKKRKAGARMAGNRQKIDGYIKSLEMSSGREVMPIEMSRKFTPEDLVALPEDVRPWYRIQTPHRVILFGYSHVFEVAPEDWKIISAPCKGSKVAITVYDDKGASLPNADNAIIVFVEASEADLKNEVRSYEIAAQVVPRVLFGPDYQVREVNI